MAALTPLPSYWPRQYTPDPANVVNVVHSVLHRIGGKVIDRDATHPTQIDFLRYVRAVATQHLQPISEADFKIDWDTYAAQANRSREYLDKIRASVNDVNFFKHEANCFIKDEQYDTIKYPRSIAALSFEAMATLSPLSKLLEKHFFSYSRLKSFFVKEVPVKDRPSLIESIFGDEQVTLGDFSSFECHHRGVYAQAVKFVMFRLLGNNGTHTLRRTLSEYLTGTNTLRFKQSGVKATIEETLMSGAPWTSFANAILSFSITSYLRLRAKYPDDKPAMLATRLFSDFTGLMEGDDSITLGGAYNTRLVADLQIKLKSEVHENFTRASFIGIIKPRGVEACITDPVKVVCRFFHLPKRLIQLGERKQKSYFRGKALSYYYQYSTCPVIAHLCEAVLKLTKSHQPLKGSLSYHREAALNEALATGDQFYRKAPDVHLQSRLLVEELYGLNLREQSILEQFFINYGNGQVNKLFKFPAVFDEYVRNGIMSLVGDSTHTNFYHPSLAPWVKTNQGVWSDSSGNVCPHPHVATLPNHTPGNV